MSSRDPLPSLVVDIGGTNTRVAQAFGTEVQITTIERFANRDFDGLGPVLDAYRAQQDMARIEAICVAVAGPVQAGIGKMTNLDWIIDRDALLADTGASVADVINDMQAQGHAIGHTLPGSVTPILAGRAAPPEATKLVINLGTGFNCAPVYETPHGRFVAPSEAGHANLPARTDTERALARHLEAEHGFAAIEDVLSGRGLANLDAWMSERQGAARRLTGAEVMAAVEKGDASACETMTVFTRLIGAISGDLALVHLPFGGIFLVGGVARAVAHWLGPFGFSKALHDKGRFSAFMQDFAVSVVEDDYAALTGCAHHLGQIASQG